MAIVSDYFIKGAPKWTGAIGSGGVADGVTTTVPLSSASGLTNGEAYFWSVVEYDANNNKTVLEVGRGTLSGTDFINCARGEEGTAQAHDAGATVEILFTAAQWNRLMTGLEVEHDPDGTHTDITATSLSLTANLDMADGQAIRDGNDNELLKLSETASAVNEVTVTNAATGNGPSITATGGDTNIDISVAGKGTGGVKLGTGTVAITDVVDQDDMSDDSAVKLATQQSIKAYVDAGGAGDGWIASSDTWTYASGSSFTISGVDRTSQLKKGTKIKLTNDGGTDYYVVKSVSFSTDTTVTFIDQDDYALANSAITNPFYSYEGDPQDFPRYFKYTPTWTGFSVDPSNPIEWSHLGGQALLLVCNAGSGTSDSATFDFTLPASEGFNRPIIYSVPCMVVDNGTWQNNAGAFGLSGGNAKVGLTISTVAANAFGGFTASGSKGLQVIVPYIFN